MPANSNKMKLINPQRYLALYNQEDYLFNSVGLKIRKRGFVTFNEFYQICMWKSSRQKPNYLKNKETVEAITKNAFAEKDEEKKMIKLRTLKGVGIPTASAILTIVFPDKYAIIDIRCMGMLEKLKFSIKKTITLKNWLKYLEIMRGLAKENGYRPRDIDKILFAMHKEFLEREHYKNLYP
jgi:thermostable 8-oxoguanine DNA glycosylase